MRTELYADESARAAHNKAHVKYQKTMRKPKYEGISSYEISNSLRPSLNRCSHIRRSTSQERFRLQDDFDADREKLKRRHGGVFLQGVASIRRATLPRLGPAARLAHRRARTFPPRTTG